MQAKLVRDVMRPAADALHRKMTLDKVSDHLTKRALTGAPVVDEQGLLIGYVSEFDCLKHLTQASYHCDKTTSVEDIMTFEPIKAAPDVTIIDLATKFNEQKVNVMPIVENDVLVGLVSRGDVMTTLVNDLDSCKIPV